MSELFVSLLPFILGSALLPIFGLEVMANKVFIRAIAFDVLTLSLPCGYRLNSK
jgi:hypothetical protein